MGQNRRSRYQREKIMFVVVEIGCGDYVPTVRKRSEQVASIFGKDATLIRINPRDHQIPKLKEVTNISLPMGGLAALKAIKERM
jgi:hypothetical protein